jgi:hypothetical protein
MNKVIHRSWGESFVKIFLDLSIDISRRSSAPVQNLIGIRNSAGVDSRLPHAISFNYSENKNYVLVYIQAQRISLNLEASCRLQRLQ